MGNTVAQDLACHTMPVGEIVVDQHTCREEFILDVHRLKNLDIFVLDCTLRDFSLGQSWRSSVSAKKRIWNCIKDHGIENFAVACFKDYKSADDEMAAYISLMGHSSRAHNYYCFAELYSKVADGVPSKDLPLSISKMSKYGLHGVILEVNITDSFIDNKKFSVQDFFQLVVFRLESIRAITRRGNIFLYCRDAFDAFKLQNDRNKFLSFVAFISMSLAARFQITGLIVEESSGSLFPWEVAEIISAMQQTMESNNWRMGQLLVKCSKGFGFDQTNVLSALSAGATGVWGGITDDGPVCGQSSVINTLTNLARMGNSIVKSKYDINSLRLAAAKVASLQPNSSYLRDEVYGAFATATLLSNMKSNLEELSDVDGHALEASLPGVPDEAALLGHLETTFGERAHDQSVVRNMYQLLLLDSKKKIKCDYFTSIGLLQLYERAGGIDYIEEMVAITVADDAFREFDDHPLLVELHQLFKHHSDALYPGSYHKRAPASLYFTDSVEDMSDDSSSDEDGVEAISFANPMWKGTGAFSDCSVSYRAFFDAFSANYLTSTATQEFKTLVQLLDKNATGSISWRQIKMRALWALAESPNERDQWDIDVLIHNIMTRFILPELERANHPHFAMYSKAVDRIHDQGSFELPRRSLLSSASADLDYDAVYAEKGLDLELHVADDDEASSQTEDSNSSAFLVRDSLTDSELVSFSQSPSTVMMEDAIRSANSSFRRPSRMISLHSDGDASSPLSRQLTSSSTLTPMAVSESADVPTSSAALKKKMDSFSGSATKSMDQILKRRRSSVTAAQNVAIGGSS